MLDELDQENIFDFDDDATPCHINLLEKLNDELQSSDHDDDDDEADLDKNSQAVSKVQT